MRTPGSNTGQQARKARHQNIEQNILASPRLPTISDDLDAPLKYLYCSNSFTAKTLLLILVNCQIS